MHTAESILEMAFEYRIAKTNTEVIEHRVALKHALDVTFAELMRLRRIVDESPPNQM